MTEPLPTAPTSSSRPRPSRGTVTDRSPASGSRSRAVDSAPCCFTLARFCDSTSSASSRASDASRASRAARSRPGFSPQCGNRWGFPAASAPTSSSRNLRQQRPRAGGETLHDGAGRAGQGHLAARRHRPRRTLRRLLGHRYQSGQCTPATITTLAISPRGSATSARRRRSSSSTGAMRSATAACAAITMCRQSRGSRRRRGRIPRRRWGEGGVARRRGIAATAGGVDRGGSGRA
jgi:hypothetical protein